MNDIQKNILNSAQKTPCDRRITKEDLSVARHTIERYFIENKKKYDKLLDSLILSVNLAAVYLNSELSKESDSEVLAKKILKDLLEALR